MDHYVGTVLCRLLRVLSPVLRLVHLHVVASPFFLLLFLLIVLAFAVFNVDLFAASIGGCVLLVRWSSSVLSTSHLSVLTLGWFTFCHFDFLFLFFDAILITVSSAQVGFGLFGRELWRSGLVRIPARISCFSCSAPCNIIPLDGESSHAWLLCQDAPADLLDDRLRGRLQLESLIRVLVVHVVADAYEFAVIIATAQENDCDANDLAVGDA
jgi:hypothetical protein